MKSNRALLAMVLILVFAGSACTPSVDQAQNIDSSSPGADNSPSIELPPPAGETQLEVASINQGALWNPDQLSSYRADYVITFDGFSNGQGIQGTISLLMEVTTDPPAQHFLMDLEGYDFGDESLTNTEVYVIGGALYANMGIEQGWISFPGGSFDDVQDALFLPEEIVDLPNAASRNVLPEIVNGVSAWRYMIDEINFQADSVLYDTMKADAWVAVDGGYLVKMDATFSGSFSEGGEANTFLDEGTIQFIFNLQDVNQGFRIELPSAALQANDISLEGLLDRGEWSREDIPLTEDATIGFSNPKMVEAGTALSVEAARDFLIEQLQANEWVFDGEPFGDSNSYFANFTKGDEFLALAINSDGQRTRFFISLE